MTGKSLIKFGIALHFMMILLGITAVNDASAFNQPGQYTFEGPVGIGTDTPAKKLTVVGGPSDGLRIVDSAGYVRIQFDLNAAGDGRFKLFDSTGTERIGFKADSVGFIEGDGNIFSVRKSISENYFSIDTANGYSSFENGNVGIGTTSPGRLLHIATDGSGPAGGPGRSSLRLEQTSAGTAWDINNFEDTAEEGAGKFGINLVGDGAKFVIDTNGNVSIGTTDTRGKLYTYTNEGDNIYVKTGWGGSRSLALHHQGTGAIMEAYNWIDGNWNGIFTIENNGHVGIGTINPDSKLHVNGNGHVAGDLTVDGNIAAKYQDLAEWVMTTEPLTPGTVVMIDTDAIDHVTPSEKPYSTLVAGVVSPAPGILLGEKGDNKAIIAHTGRVKVKVDTTTGAIDVGDLLVTSSVKGYAMKADSNNLKPGMLLGKALQPLAKGQQGKVLTLITLQ